jgi:hypothetical protein
MLMGITNQLVNILPGDLHALILRVGWVTGVVHQFLDLTGEAR